MTSPRILAGLFAAAAVFGQPAAITAIRHLPQPDGTRVVIDFDGEFEFSHQRLAGPDRVFFDFPGSALRLEGATRRAATIPLDSGFVLRVRVAETRPGIHRVVFDLARDGLAYSATRLANPPRLAVDFRASAPAAAPAVPQPPRITLDQMRREAAAAALTAKVSPPPAAPEPAAPLPPLAAKPATPAQQPSRSLTRALGLKVARIVIDPGHGGHDFGASSPTGLHEKDLVLDIAKRLGELLSADLGAQVIYTRTDDTFVPLETRTAFANAQKADLFLSLHANYSRLKSIAGPETFYLNFAGSREAMELAARENAASGRTVFELRELVRQITLHDKVQESREFATHVQASLKALGPAGVKDRGVKRAPFMVLIGASMPSILAEIGFLSNAREAALLRTPHYRQRVAEALAKGVVNYAETLSRMDLAMAAGSAVHTQ